MWVVAGTWISLWLSTTVKVYFESGGRASDEMTQTGRREASSLDREDAWEEKGRDLSLAAAYLILRQAKRLLSLAGSQAIKEGQLVASQLL